MTQNQGYYGVPRTQQPNSTIGDGCNIFGKSFGITHFPPEKTDWSTGTEVVPRKKDGWQNNFCLCARESQLWGFEIF